MSQEKGTGCGYPRDYQRTANTTEPYPQVIALPSVRGTSARVAASAGKPSHVGSADGGTGGRRTPLNPEGGRSNRVAGVCAIIDRIENGGDTGATARSIEREFGSTARPRVGSNPLVATVNAALNYIQRATGLSPSFTPVDGGFPAARALGHYALFVNESHVVYGRVFDSGRSVIADPQIARGFGSLAAYKGYLAQHPNIYGSDPQIIAYYLGPVNR